MAFYEVGDLKKIPRNLPLSLSLQADRFGIRNNRSAGGGGGRQPTGMVPCNVFAATCGNEVALNETLETGFPINLLNALIVASANYTASLFK